MRPHTRNNKKSPVNPDPSKWRGIHAFDTAQGKRNRPSRHKVGWVNESAVSAAAWAAVAASLRPTTLLAAEV